MTKPEIDFISERYTGKLPLATALIQYEALPEFNINENIFDVFEKSEIQITDVNGAPVEFNNDVHQIVRLRTQYHMTNVFKAMKINLDDPNVEESSDTGNIGTPGRIAKMWCGHNIKDDTEMMSGRFMQKPRMAAFPNSHESRIPITKRVDLNSVCSHHAAIFSSFYREDSYAIVSYIPDQKVLGISKLQRVVDWVARRGWLQEDLCKSIFDEVSKVAETDSVYVKLHNITHSCERNRGAQSSDGAFTTEYYGGQFEDKALRDGIGQ